MAKRNLLGIDPGLSGAFVLLSENDGLILVEEVFDMPTSTRQNGKRQVDASVLALQLMGLPDVYMPLTACVEYVSAMPGQGVSSMFQFGEGCGVLRGVLAALSIPATYITPVKWKKMCGLQGKDKQYALTVAKQLIPGMARYLTAKKHIGRADAALIAWTGLRQ